MTTRPLADLRGIFALVTLALALASCSIPSSTTTQATASAPDSLSDGQILQVLRTLHEGEVEQAQLVPQKSEHPALQNTAERIIEDHGRYNLRIDAMVQPGWPLEESTINQRLARLMQQTFSQMVELEGIQFDCYYLNKQVEQHQVGVDTLRGELLPEARDEQVKALLSSLAPALEYHLRAAQETLQNFPNCNPGSPTSGTAGEQAEFRADEQRP